MRQLTPTEQYITNKFSDSNIKNLNSQSLEFYHELVNLLKLVTPFQSTSAKLGKRFNRSERTIQRYVKALKEAALINIYPHYNNDNPDKPYVDYNRYELSNYAHELQKEAEYYVNRDRNVNFVHKVTT